ncbi:MAG TPA: MarR family transcriptional regulator, partial [Chloroflexia bacterium]|nr:MarR family transcriptional regulator [Chloroflexia bacterium]
KLNMSLGTKTSTAQLEKKKLAPVTTSLNSSNRLERDALEQSCTHKLLTILPTLRQIVNRDREGDPTQITFQQYNVLKALQEQKLLISELADMLKVSRPTMSRIIDGLEGRRRLNGTSEENRRPKLVERIACQDDHRLVYAHITPEGLNILHTYRSQAEENICALLRQLPQDDLPVVLYALEALHEAIGQFE